MRPTGRRRATDGSDGRLDRPASHCSCSDLAGVSAPSNDTIVRRHSGLEAAAIAGIVYAVFASASLLLVLNYPSPDLADAEQEAWFADSGNRRRL